jgi:hypothetical protein
MSLPVVTTKSNFTSVTGVLVYDLPQAFTFCTSPSQIVILFNSVQQNSNTYTFDSSVPRVTFLTQPTVGVNIEFRTAIPVNQLLSYPRGGSFPSIASERGLDKLTVLISQLQDTANFGVPGTPPAGITLPILDARYPQLVNLPVDLNVPRQSQYQNKNYIQNSNYAVQQRLPVSATLQAPNTNGSNYLVDRWYLHGDASTPDVVQGLLSDPVLGKAVHQINRVGNTSSNLRYGEFIEDQDCRQLAGKTVTLTVRLATGPGYSGSNVVLGVNSSNNPAIRMNALVAQAPIANVTINPTTGAYSTTSLTFTVPADVRALAPILQITRVAATSGTNDYVRIADWQLEEGLFFTGFRHESVANTVNACMRYLEILPIGIVAYSATASTNFRYTVKWSVPKYSLPVRIADNIASAINNVSGFAPGLGSGLFNNTLFGGSYSVGNAAIGFFQVDGEQVFTCEP